MLKFQVHVNVVGGKQRDAHVRGCNHDNETVVKGHNLIPRNVHNVMKILKFQIEYEVRQFLGMILPQ